ncbi:MAG: hypothetical protein AAF367_19430 [Pseudomonadota bacterium]
MTSRRKPAPSFDMGGLSNRPPIGQILGLIALAFIDLLMLGVLFGTYAETMGMLSDVYLCDLPLIGPPSCALDDEMTVSHLLALLLAIFSIAVPMAIWNEMFRQDIFADPQGWIAKPANRIYAGIALGVYTLVVALEVVNLYTLIAQQSVGGPFITHNQPPLMEFLAQNQGLGIFVAGLVAVVNTVLAFLTVRAAHALKKSMEL